LQQQLMRHTKADELIFDSRGGIRTRWYLRALLHGVARIIAVALGNVVPSQEPQAFYRLLILGVACAPGRPATEYLAILNDKRRRKGELTLALPDHEKPPIPLPPIPEGGGFTLPPDGEDLVPPPRRRGGGQGSLRSREGRGRGGKGGAPDPPAPPPIPLPPVPPVVEPTPPVELVLPPLEDDHGDGNRRPTKRVKVGLDWKDGVDGSKACFKNYLHTGAAEPYANYQIKCGNSQHRKDCHKTRGAQYCTAHGHLEPLAFLHAWRELNWPWPGAKASHALEDPSGEAVEEYLRAHGAELQDCYDRLHDNA